MFEVEGETYFEIPDVLASSQVLAVRANDQRDPPGLKNHSTTTQFTVGIRASAVAYGGTGRNKGEIIEAVAKNFHNEEQGKYVVVWNPFADEPRTNSDGGVIQGFRRLPYSAFRTKVQQALKYARDKLGGPDTHTPAKTQDKAFLVENALGALIVLRAFMNGAIGMPIEPQDYVDDDEHKIACYKNAPHIRYPAIFVLMALLDACNELYLSQKDHFIKELIRHYVVCTVLYMGLRFVDESGNDLMLRQIHQKLDQRLRDACNKRQHLRIDLETDLVGDATNEPKDGADDAGTGSDYDPMELPNDDGGMEWLVGDNPDPAPHMDEWRALAADTLAFEEMAALSAENLQDTAVLTRLMAIQDDMVIPM